MTRRQGGSIAALGLTVALAGAVQAQDRADIDRTQIIGNKELPKVIYIVPWKKPIHEETKPGAATNVLDEVLAPVDRDVFRRQLRYDAAGTKGAEAGAAAPTSASPAR